jgi:predicted small lipoprotein YifL
MRALMAATVLLAALLTACGQTGPLYQPGDEPAAGRAAADQ